MRNCTISIFCIIVCFIISLFSLTGCLTSKKIDSYVAQEYNNEVTKQDKKKKADIAITSSYQSNDSKVSATVPKTSRMLPLLFYWQFDYRHTCSLNPNIAVNKFANTLYTLSAKSLAEKLNGQKLELKVEQVPAAFAIVDKAHIIWLIYAFGWDKVYIEPDRKDLIVSYKLLQASGIIKTGMITIKNPAQNQGIHQFSESWKSATSDWITGYHNDLANMTKSFVNKLEEVIN